MNKNVISKQEKLISLAIYLYTKKMCEITKNNDNDNFLKLGQAMIKLFCDMENNEESTTMMRVGILAIVNTIEEMNTEEFKSKLDFFLSQDIPPSIFEV